MRGKTRIATAVVLAPSLVALVASFSILAFQVAGWRDDNSAALPKECTKVGERALTRLVVTDVNDAHTGVDEFARRVECNWSTDYSSDETRDRELTVSVTSYKKGLGGRTAARAATYRFEQQRAEAGEENEVVPAEVVAGPDVGDASYTRLELGKDSYNQVAIVAFRTGTVIVTVTYSGQREVGDEDRALPARKAAKQAAWLAGRLARSL